MGKGVCCVQRESNMMYTTKSCLLEAGMFTESLQLPQTTCPDLHDVGQEHFRPPSNVSVFFQVNKNVTYFAVLVAFFLMYVDKPIYKSIVKFDIFTAVVLRS